MKDFLGEQELNLDQATCIARAMWKVAEIERGVHAQEREMIEAFYHACCEESGAQPEDLSARPWDIEEARRLLDSTSLQDTLVRSCYLLGYADGNCSPVEKALIDQMARDLGLSDERRTTLDREVKRMLLSQFEEIKLFRDATYDIGRQLGLSTAEVDDMLTEKKEES